jgi:pyridoxine 4-dehydrogenase
MKASLDRGANFWAGAEYYGPADANSLQMLNHYFTKYPSDSDKVILSIKGAYYHNNLVTGRSGPDNSRAGIQRSVENCLAILDGKAPLSIFTPGRIDLSVPLEETITTLAEYVKAGKIGGYGLSEVNARTLRAAHAIYPVAAIEVEVSLFSTHTLTNGVTDACAELGIPIIAYSPLSRGFLTGKIKQYSDLAETDTRRLFPRFFPEVFDENLKLVNQIQLVAARAGFTVAQVAIAWVAARSQRLGIPVIPIPGCTTLERVEENLKRVQLTDEDFEALEKLAESIEVKGGRYPEAHQKQLDL